MGSELRGGRPATFLGAPWRALPPGLTLSWAKGAGQGDGRGPPWRGRRASAWGAGGSEAGGPGGRTRGCQRKIPAAEPHPSLLPRPLEQPPHSRGGWGAECSLEPSPTPRDAQPPPQAAPWGPERGRGPLSLQGEQGKTAAICHCALSSQGASLLAWTLQAGGASVEGSPLSQGGRSRGGNPSGWGPRPRLGMRGSCVSHPTRPARRGATPRRRPGGREGQETPKEAEGEEGEGSTQRPQEGGDAGGGGSTYGAEGKRVE